MHPKMPSPGYERDPRGYLDGSFGELSAKTKPGYPHTEKKDMPDYVRYRVETLLESYEIKMAVKFIVQLNIKHTDAGISNYTCAATIHYDISKGAFSKIDLDLNPEGNEISDIIFYEIENELRKKVNLLLEHFNGYAKNLRPPNINNGFIKHAD
jgi:hypothetical protein